MRVHRRAALACALVAGSLPAAGCANTGILRGGTHATASRLQGQEAVIRGWSDALRTGHVRAAAGYFRVPSEFINGPGDAYVIHSLGAAVAINAQLPCGAKLISVKQQRRFVNALFRLTTRTGRGATPGGCGSAVGQTARVDFLIRDGKIVQWVRAPDNSGGGSGAPTVPGPTV